jgi:spermidine synthase
MGVGVVAAAMQQHGLHVEAVELDPAVAELAVKYFGVRCDIAALKRVFVVGQDLHLIFELAILLHRNESIHVADGIEWVAQYQGPPFDIVAHDVFTGGAVPAALFEKELFADVKVRSIGVSRAKVGLMHGQV